MGDKQVDDGHGHADGAAAHGKAKNEKSEIPKQEINTKLNDRSNSTNKHFEGGR